MKPRLFGMTTTTHSKQYTRHALKSFFEHTPFASTDTFILIDNDNDFHQDDIDPRVQIVKNSAPLGFAENMNRAIDRAVALHADLYFMNNDLILTPHWIEPLLRDEPEILSPLSNREVPYNFEDLHTPVQMSLEQYLGREASLLKLCEVHRQSTQGYMKVTVLPFFCVKVPLVIMQQLGYLDESFGKGGGEDYDYCLRAFLGGFSVKFCLSSFILHFGGKSSWSGVESREQQTEREVKFISMFGHKWGTDLMKFILYEDRTIVPEGSALHQQMLSGDHAGAIRKLMGDHVCPVRIGERGC